MQNLIIPPVLGLSGSGKSSLAFDTIYAEGQRRYVESLSAYARQFLDKMKKPNVDLFIRMILRQHISDTSTKNQKLMKKMIGIRN